MLIKCDGRCTVDFPFVSWGREGGEDGGRGGGGAGGGKESKEGDSNPKPLDPECNALTTGQFPHNLTETEQPLFFQTRLTLTCFWKGLRAAGGGGGGESPRRGWELGVGEGVGVGVGGEKDYHYT